MLPVTLQCGATGVPAIVKSPAAIVAAALIVVFANEKLVASGSHGLIVAPVAALNCGSESSELLPPPLQPESSGIEIAPAGDLGWNCRCIRETPGKKG